MSKRESPKANDSWWQPIVQPPSSVTVDHERKPVLYQHDGKPLVRKIGYRQ